MPHLSDSIIIQIIKLRVLLSSAFPRRTLPALARGTQPESSLQSGSSWTARFSSMYSRHVHIVCYILATHFCIYLDVAAWEISVLPAEGMFNGKIHIFPLVQLFDIVVQMASEQRVKSKFPSIQQG